MAGLYNCMSMVMSVGSGGPGGRKSRAPLDFHTWYKYSREKLKSAIFRCSFAIFCLFSVAPPPPWKRLNSAIFSDFFADFLVFIPLVPPWKIFCRRPWAWFPWLIIPENLEWLLKFLDFWNWLCVKGFSWCALKDLFVDMFCFLDYAPEF